MKNKSELSVVLTFVAILGIYLMDFGGTTKLIQNLAYLFPPALAVISGIYAVRIYGYKNIHGTALLFIVLGLFCWLFGEILWIVLDLIFRQTPFPSIADFFYIAGYPLVFTGFIFQFKAVKFNWSKSANKLILILAMAVSICLMIFVGYLEIFHAYDAGESFTVNLLNLIYGFGDLLLVIASLFTFIVSREYSGGKFSYPLICKLSGLGLYLLGDLLVGIYKNQYYAFEKPYYMIDLFWVGGYLLFAYAFLLIVRHVREVQKKIHVKK